MTSKTPTIDAVALQLTGQAGLFGGKEPKISEIEIGRNKLTIHFSFGESAGQRIQIPKDFAAKMLIEALSLKIAAGAVAAEGPVVK